MAHNRYSMTVKSTKQFTRPSNTFYANSDQDAKDVSALVSGTAEDGSDSKLENNAKMQVSLVIKEPGNYQMPASPADTKASYFNFCSSQDSNKKWRLYIPGLKDATSIETLGKAIASSGKLRNREGIVMDVFTGDGRKQNIVTGSTASFYDPAPVVVTP